MQLQITGTLCQTKSLWEPTFSVPQDQVLVTRRQAGCGLLGSRRWLVQGIDYQARM